MTERKGSGNTPEGSGEGQQGAVPKETTAVPKKLVTERLEKGAYKGPTDSKPMQPQQMVSPQPTNQPGGGTDDGGQQSGDTGDSGQQAGSGSD
jgi:hypothetical protein